MTSEANNTVSQRSESAKKGEERGTVMNQKHKKREMHADTTESDARSNKRHRACDNDDDIDVLDVASSLGIKAGDRILAKWDLTDDDGNVTTTRWWGATLTEYDGRTTDDNVAIRVLNYDPYPEGGFPDHSLEDVVFVNNSILINDNTDELEYRMEGADSTTNTVDEETVALSEDRLREALNGMLVAILNKHGKQWQSLDASRQAQIAELFSKGKEKLIEVVQNRWEKDQKVIKAEDVPSILADAFGDAMQKR
mmetsp:Transcript_7323/g.12767  ORF Transcript_7323/g.12767 Transcript_7323/m.12767 type:complete len:253 (-) Transcript_7323:82-840(-)